MLVWLLAEPLQILGLTKRGVLFGSLYVIFGKSNHMVLSTLQLTVVCPIHPPTTYLFSWPCYFISLPWKLNHPVIPDHCEGHLKSLL